MFVGYWIFSSLLFTATRTWHEERRERESRVGVWWVCVHSVGQIKYFSQFRLYAIYMQVSFSLFSCIIHTHIFAQGCWTCVFFSIQFRTLFFFSWIPPANFMKFPSETLVSAAAAAAVPARPTNKQLTLSTRSLDYSPFVLFHPFPAVASIEYQRKKVKWNELLTEKSGGNGKCRKKISLCSKSISKTFCMKSEREVSVFFIKNIYML